MVDANNKVTDGNIKATDARPNPKDAKPNGNGNTKPNKEDETEDEKAEREEAEARDNGFKYASKVSKEGDEPQGLDSEADQSSASWLVANGYAEMHSIQEGVDTINYILLTEEGKRALSTYNEEAE